MFWKYRLPIIGFLLIVIVATVSHLAISEVGVRRVPTVHALLVIPVDDPAIGASQQQSSSKMQALILRIKDDCRVHMTVMELRADNTAMVTVTKKNRHFTDEQSSKQMTGIIGTDLITAWLRDLEPWPVDTILVYYTGHGGINESGQHLLRFDGKDNIRRDELSDLLAQKQGRLKLLITDTDSEGPPVTVPLRANTQYRKVVKPLNKIDVGGGASIVKRGQFRHLFLQHTGFLNLTAATEGEYAWAAGESGSLFTNALCDAINDNLDLDGDGFLSWEEVFKVTREDTRRLFDVISVRLPGSAKSDLDQRRIESQRPKYYGELPKPH